VFNPVQRLLLGGTISALAADRQLPVPEPVQHANGIPAEVQLSFGASAISILATMN
jgi:hypothetical protein